MYYPRVVLAAKIFAAVLMIGLVSLLWLETSTHREWSRGELPNTNSPTSLLVLFEQSGLSFRFASLCDSPTEVYAGTIPPHLYLSNLPNRASLIQRPDTPILSCTNKDELLIYCFRSAQEALAFIATYHIQAERVNHLIIQGDPDLVFQVKQSIKCFSS